MSGGLNLRTAAVSGAAAFGDFHACPTVAHESGKILVPSASEIPYAIAIGTVDKISLACVHAEPVVQ
jgi:hypothetical protein